MITVANLATLAIRAASCWTHIADAGSTMIVRGLVRAGVRTSCSTGMSAEVSAGRLIIGNQIYHNGTRISAEIGQLRSGLQTDQPENTVQSLASG